MLNVFDFDGTIYNGDSTLDFYKFALVKHPSLIRYLPKQMYGVFRYLMGYYDKTKMKETFFCFLNGIDAEKLSILFWGKKQRKIGNWYKSIQNESDVIISASPEFLLQPICERLKIGKLIASRVDPNTGKFVGNNCYGAEKVRRLYEEFGRVRINRFYSDSKSDLPLAKISLEKYRIKKGKVKEWKI